MSRGEFGLVGAERIVSLLAKYVVASTWFTPGLPGKCCNVCDGGHELAHHGRAHMSPAYRSRDEEQAGLVRANEAIEKISGKPARGYRSPAWDLSENTIDLLLKHGFIYESSMMGHNRSPYYAGAGDVIEPDKPMVFGEETSLIGMPISWSLDDYPHFEFVQNDTYRLQGLMATKGVLQNWVDDIDYMTRTTDWGVLTYTCHPFVSGRGHTMMMLECLMLKLKELGAVFLTMEEAVEERCQRNQ